MAELFRSDKYVVNAYSAVVAIDIRTLGRSLATHHIPNGIRRDRLIADIANARTQGEKITIIERALCVCRTIRTLKQ